MNDLIAAIYHEWVSKCNRHDWISTCDSMGPQSYKIHPQQTIAVML